MLNRQLHHVLDNFFSAQSMEDLVKGLPRHMSKSHIDIIASRWPFFKAMRDDILTLDYECYPRLSLFKSIYQSLYNALKGGLDANTEQYISIRPNVSVTFEAKYVLRMILAIVTNSWRAYQLLNIKGNIKEMTRFQIKKQLQNSAVRLTTFNYDLAMDLIRASDENGILNNPRVTTDNQPITDDLYHGLQLNPLTLRQRLADEVWPIRYKVKCFNRNETFVELRLTQNKDFVHNCTKMVNVRNHCSLCYDWQTKYGCETCKVLLCRTVTFTTVNGVKMSSHDSCFSIWHGKRNIEVEKKSYEGKNMIHHRVKNHLLIKEKVNNQKENESE